MTPRGYIVPFFFGGISGLLFGLWNIKLNRTKTKIQLLIKRIPVNILQRLYIYLNGNLLLFFIRVINKTLRIQVTNNSTIDFFNDRNVLFAIWHQNTFTPFYKYRDRNVGMFISDNTKGAILGYAANRLGYDTLILKDDSAKALINMGKRLKNGQNGLIAVDGAIGPRQKIRGGVFYISDRYKTPVVSVHVSYKTHLKLLWRWDHYKLPLPFSRVCIVFSDNIDGDNREVSLANLLS